VAEKMAGLKDEVKGKITGRSDLVEHGRQQKTGQLKKKEMEDNVSAIDILMLLKISESLS
jgi:hypothetical protein